jgi:hypothetical protein
MLRGILLFCFLNSRPWNVPRRVKRYRITGDITFDEKKVWRLFQPPRPIQSLLRSLNQRCFGSQAFFQLRVNPGQIYVHFRKVRIYIKFAAPDECLCIYNDRCQFGAF